MNSLSASLCRTFWWTMQQTWSPFLWWSIPGPQMRLTASSVCPSLQWLWPGQLPCDLVCPRLVNTSKQVMLSKATSFDLNGFFFFFTRGVLKHLLFVSSTPFPKMLSTLPRPLLLTLPQWQCPLYHHNPPPIKAQPQGTPTNQALVTRAITAHLCSSSFHLPCILECSLYDLSHLHTKG